MVIEFLVEQAGCSLCAERVRRALEPFATVEGVEIDEAADVAAVLLRTPELVTEATIDAALRDVSAGAGHAYRVKPGSWLAAA